MVYTFLLCIKFHNFNLNPYFEDTKLTKTFMFFDEGSNQIWIFFVSPNWKMVNWFLSSNFLSTVHEYG